MEAAALERWTDFAVVVGGASAALTGLLFVAIVLAVPDQGFVALGVELLAVVVIAGAGLLTLDRRAKREAETPPLARTLDVASPNVVTLLFVAATGVVLLTGHEWGLYLLVPSTVIAIVGGVANAWLFLTQLAE